MEVDVEVIAAILRFRENGELVASASVSASEGEAEIKAMVHSRPGLTLPRRKVMEALREVGIHKAMFRRADGRRVG